MHAEEKHSKKARHQPRREKGPVTKPYYSLFVEGITKITEELSAQEKIVANYVFHQLEDLDSK